MESADIGMVESPEFYAALDPGIRFAVRVLHANGIETVESCEGGAGHGYDRPTIDLWGLGDDSRGFAALAVLHEYGLPVRDVAILWRVAHGQPMERLWRITFWTAMVERSDESPQFVWGYRPSGPLASP